jgi:hypothetical protein
MLETSIVMSLISILGFTTEKIRFQAVRNSLLISTLCGAAWELKQCCRNGGTHGDDWARIGKITIGILPPTFNADDGPTVAAVTHRHDGCETAPMDCTFRPRAISFSRVNHGHQLEVTPAFEQLIWNNTWH